MKKDIGIFGIVLRLSIAFCAGDRRSHFRVGGRIVPPGRVSGVRVRHIVPVGSRRCGYKETGKQHPQALLNRPAKPVGGPQALQGGIWRMRTSRFMELWHSTAALAARADPSTGQSTGVAGATTSRPSRSDMCISILVVRGSPILTPSAWPLALRRRRSTTWRALSGGPCPRPDLIP